MYALRANVKRPPGYPFHAVQQFVSPEEGINITARGRRIVDCLIALEGIDNPKQWVEDAKKAIEIAAAIKQKEMNQQKADKFFASEIGKQCVELFSTRDGRAFVRRDDAVYHFTTVLTDGDEPSEDDIKVWYPSSIQHG